MSSLLLQSLQGGQGVRAGAPEYERGWHRGRSVVWGGLVEAGERVQARQIWGVWGWGVCGIGVGKAGPTSGPGLLWRDTAPRRPASSKAFLGPSHGGDGWGNVSGLHAAELHACSMLTGPVIEILV